MKVLSVNLQINTLTLALQMFVAHIRINDPYRLFIGNRKQHQRVSKYTPMPNGETERQRKTPSERKTRTG